MSKNERGLAHPIRAIPWLLLFLFLTASPSNAEPSFAIPRGLQHNLGVENYKGFLLLENLEEGWNSNYAVISNFEGNILESQTLLGASNLEKAKTLIDRSLSSHNYRGLEIRQLSLPIQDGQELHLYWIGHRAYPSLEEAQKAADLAIAQGISFQESVEEEKAEPEKPITVQEVLPGEEISPEEPEEPQEKSHYPLALDQKIQRVAIPGTKIEPEKDRFYTQYFGEGSWRRTNFDRPRPEDKDYFNTFVGFLTTRIIMKGLRLYPKGPSLDPYIEGTISLASRDDPFENKIVPAAGLEYRPVEGWSLLSKSPWTEWLQRIRVFGQYMDLYTLRSDLGPGSPTYDWRAGFDLYKDWGWSKPFDEQDRDHFHHYLWGELYWESTWRKTDFNRDDYESLKLTGVGWLGLKFPWVDGLPPLMPYVALELNETQRDYFFQNRFIVSYGIRYMPFHTSRFQGYEWLYNLKLFAEYGEVESYFKDEPPDDRPDWDFRAGIKIDLNRF